MTKLQAIRQLEEMGSHMIVETEWANKVGKPFGITFAEVHFKPNGDPKGPLQECKGVDTFSMAARIANSVGASRQDFFGRGSQFRSDMEEAKKVLKKK